ncbi:hypothetical protein ZWY2020_044563 [Hordeum vulgare]|nr:hypothetical protein ZWY2020_044563 [Hordeum vulgare]
MATLSSRIVSCIGVAPVTALTSSSRVCPGSLAEQVAKTGLDGAPSVATGFGVASGLTYLHAAGMVHGDVKSRNVVIGADGRAKLADFGCSRKAAADVPIIGGTPAFMVPEVARGEEQGPAADVWALGCMVVEMATGRAPWSGIDGNALAALHRIGYTEAVPEVPEWLSADGKDFLASCLVRQASGRCTAAQLLEHPFLASAVVEVKPQAVASKWVSPKSTLDAAFWESESESDTEEAQHDSTAEMRIKVFACPASALPDWDSKEGWIVVLSAPTVAPEAASEETTDMDDDAITNEEPSGAEPAVLGMIVYQECSSVVGAGDAYDDSVS